MKKQGKRYTRGYSGEEQLSKNVREMIAMIRNEKASKGRIKYHKLRLSQHAKIRASQYLDCKEENLLGRVKCMLRQAKRVGEQLAYDGRINVLYVFNQYGIYLSPNLECVITIRKFDKVSYRPIRKQLKELSENLKGSKLRKELVKLHKEAWANIEKAEAEQEKKVVEIDQEVRSNIAKLKQLKTGFSPKHYKKYLKERLNEERGKLIGELVQEGEKLFNLKCTKRHIGKSIASVL